jgi:two-component system response regulator QseB
LRKRFADLGVVIRTVRGFGYVMEAAAPGSGEASAPGSEPHG